MPEGQCPDSAIVMTTFRGYSCMDARIAPASAATNTLSPATFRPAILRLFFCSDPSHLHSVLRIPQNPRNPVMLSSCIPAACGNAITDRSR